MPDPLWIVRAVPAKPKQLRNAVTSSDHCRCLTQDRDAHALPHQAARVQRIDPVGAQDLVREQTGRRHDCRRVRLRSTAGVDRAGAGRCSAIDRRCPGPSRGRDRRARRHLLGDVETQARHRVDVPVQARPQLRGVDRERHRLRSAGRIQIPLRAEHLLRIRDADRRPHTQVRDIDRCRDAIGLERIDDCVSRSRRSTVFLLQRRQRQVLAIARRRRIARRLQRVLDPLLVGDQAELERELQPGGRRPQVPQTVVRDVPEIDTRRRGNSTARRNTQRENQGEHDHAKRRPPEHGADPNSAVVRIEAP